MTLNIDDNRNRLFLSISKFQFVFRIKVKPADDGYWVVCFNFLYQWHQTKNLRSRLRFLKIKVIQWFHKFNQTFFVFYLRKKKTKLRQQWLKWLKKLMDMHNSYTNLYYHSIAYPFVSNSYFSASYFCFMFFLKFNFERSQTLSLS